MEQVQAVFAVPQTTFNACMEMYEHLRADSQLEEMPPLALAIAPASKMELGDFSMFNFRTMKFPEQEGPLDMETDKLH